MPLSISLPILSFSLTQPFPHHLLTHFVPSWLHDSSVLQASVLLPDKATNIFSLSLSFYFFLSSSYHYRCLFSLLPPLLWLLLFFSSLPSYFRYHVLFSSFCFPLTLVYNFSRSLRQAAMTWDQSEVTCTEQGGWTNSWVANESCSTRVCVCMTVRVNDGQ